MARATYLIAIGSNRRGRAGSPRAVVARAAATLPGTLLAVAPIMATPPLGPSKRRFANSAALIGSDLDPPALLAALQRIERDFGRRGGRRWGPRVLDLDIVLWSGGSFAADDLVIPHPAFRTRPFVLAPAVAIAPGWRDPLSGRTLRQLGDRLRRPRPVDPRRRAP